MSIRQILESDSEIGLLEVLLRLYTTYTDQFPASGADVALEDMRANKGKVIPKDDLAKDILTYAVTNGAFPTGAYQQLNNMRFSDLPMSLRPVYLSQEGHEKVAYWGQGDKISDKVVSLLDFKAKGDIKGWICSKGDKVELISKKDK